MEYSHCGNSGLMLPKVSLGLWHNFGDTANFENMKQLCFTAFDNGITQFDLANNYGPEPGSAEKNFGKILKEDLGIYRDELIITTKAGYEMWDGPYGNWGSRKYLLASLDQSLKRMGLEYVDIFYHHRMDPDTPLEETMGALASAVQSGKALYVGLSNYDGKTLSEAAAILKDLRCPFVINQNRYSIFDRTVEKNGFENRHRGFSPCAVSGILCLNFSPVLISGKQPVEVCFRFCFIDVIKHSEFSYEVRDGSNIVTRRIFHNGSTVHMVNRIICTPQQVVGGHAQSVCNGCNGFAFGECVFRIPRRNCGA